MATSSADRWSCFLRVQFSTLIGAQAGELSSGIAQALKSFGKPIINADLFCFVMGREAWSSDLQLILSVTLCKQDSETGQELDHELDLSVNGGWQQNCFVERHRRVHPNPGRRIGGRSLLCRVDTRGGILQGV
jgi:hypothetical protein